MDYGRQAYVYVLNVEGKTKFGVSTNLNQRLRAHNYKKSRYRGFSFVGAVWFSSKEKAYDVEALIKKEFMHNRIKQITNGFEWSSSEFINEAPKDVFAFANSFKGFLGRHNKIA